MTVLSTSSSTSSLRDFLLPRNPADDESSIVSVEDYEMSSNLRKSSAASRDSVAVAESVKSAVLDGPLDHNKVVDKYNTVRLGIQIAGGVTAVMARCAMRVPDGSGEPAFAALHSTSLTLFELWALNRVLDDLLGPKGEYEIILLQRKGCEKCYLVCSVTA